MRVDLPAPFSPQRPRISPSRTVSDTSSSARVPGKSFVTWRISSKTFPRSVTTPPLHKARARRSWHEAKTSGASVHQRSLVARRPLVPGDVAIHIFQAVESALDNPFMQVVLRHRHHVDEDGVLLNAPLFVYIRTVDPRRALA